LTDYVWPDDLVPYAVSFYLQPHTGGSESPFSRVSKTYGLSAPRWVCRMELRGGDSSHWGNGPHARAGPRLDAFIASLKGRENRVALYDFRRERMWDGTPYGASNLAASAGDTSLTLTGLDEGRLIRAGDYIGGDGRPHLITEDAMAGSDGQATVYFQPPLAIDLAVGDVVTFRVAGTFRLTSDDAGDNASQVGDLAVYSLEFVEDVALPTINSSPASVLGEGFGDYLAIDFSTSDIDNAVSRRDPTLADFDGSIRDFFDAAIFNNAMTVTNESGASEVIPAGTIPYNFSRPVRTVRGDVFSFMDLTKADHFTMTRPVVFHVAYYRNDGIADGSVSFANAGNTQRINVGVIGEGTDDARLATAVVTTGGSMTVNSYGLVDEPGDPEDDLIQHNILITNDKMVVSINGEEPILFDAKVKAGFINNLTMFAPELITVFGATADVDLRRIFIANVDANFNHEDLRRLHLIPDNPQIKDIHTVVNFGQLSAASEWMPRMGVIAGLRQTGNTARWLVFYAGSSSTAWAENPARIMVRPFSAIKAADGTVTITSSVADPVAFYTPALWPAGTAQPSAPTVLAPTFGADSGKLFAAFDNSGTSGILAKESTDNGVTWGADAVKIAQGAWGTLVASVTGTSYEVPSGTYAGRILFPVYGNLGMALAWRDPNGTWGIGTPVGLVSARFPSETSIAGLPDGRVVLFSRLHETGFGGADAPNEVGIYTAAVDGTAPVLYDILTTADDYQGAAVQGAIAQLDPTGASDLSGMVAHLRALTEGTPVRLGSRLSIYGGSTFERFYDANLMSKWGIRGYHDMRHLNQWGSGYFLASWERSLDTGNGHSSVYTGIFDIGALDLGS
jgi:hypothetical protein